MRRVRPTETFLCAGGAGGPACDAAPPSRPPAEAYQSARQQRPRNPLHGAAEAGLVILQTQSVLMLALPLGIVCRTRASRFTAQHRRAVFQSLWSQRLVPPQRRCAELGYCGALRIINGDSPSAFGAQAEEDRRASCNPNFGCVTICPVGARIAGGCLDILPSR